MGSVRRNGPFVFTMLLSIAATTALMVFTAGVLFIITDILRLGALFLQLILVQQIALIISVPFVVRLANAIGKHRTMGLGCAGLSLGFAGLALVPAGQFPQAALVLVVVGASAGTLFVLLPSMAADTIDYGALRLGAGQPGLYMSIFSLGSKLSTAFGVGIGLPLLQLAGFDARGHGDPTLSRRALVMVCLVLPSVILLVTGAAAWAYPLTKRKHRVVMARLASLARHAEGEAQPVPTAAPAATEVAAAPVNGASRSIREARNA
jgi:Na+/melibiose symporter-like transporter